MSDMRLSVACLNGKREAAAVRTRRRKHDVAAMQTRDAAHDCKPEPRSARFRSSCRIHAIEPLKHARGVLARNADAAILDDDLDAIASRGDRHLDIGRTRVANCVFHEI